MAKAKDLAALAALGMLGYKMSQGKDNATAPAYPSGVMGGSRMDQGVGSVVSRPGESTISNPDPVAEDADNTTAAALPSGVMGGARQKTAPRSVKNNTTAPKYPSGVMASPKDPRELEAGMSRGSRYKQPTLMNKGGAVKKMASGGMTASSRADGIASKGKTKCKMY